MTFSLVSKRYLSHCFLKNLPYRPLPRYHTETERKNPFIIREQSNKNRCKKVILEQLRGKENREIRSQRALFAELS